MNILGDTTITPNIQVGMAIMGKLLTGLSEDASPTDDTPSIITQDEKLARLGGAAVQVVGELGK